MNTLSVILFYASILFGFLCGMVATYRIGRVGWTQFWYWAAGSGATRSMPELFAYGSTILGPSIGKLWFFIGVPAFLLDIVLTHFGYEYYPSWLNQIGLVSTGRRIAVILSRYVFAYILGRLSESRQSSFNRARLLYERVVANKGYWFDHKDNRGYYDDPDARPVLEQAEALYKKVLSELEQGRGSQFMASQNLMILHYQRALLYCTLGQFPTAKNAIAKARELKAKIPSSQWEPNEEQTFESQLLFLEGEIAIAEGRKADAQNYFAKSMEIDKSLKDTTGIEKNQERMSLLT